MEKKLEKISSSKIKLNITLNHEEFSFYISKIKEILSGEIEIPGFRKGQAPKEILEAKIGKEEILKRAANLAIEEILPRVFQEKNLKIIDGPEVYLKKNSDEGLEFSAKAEIFPEIKLSNWREIVKSVARREIKVTLDEIKSVLRELQESRAKIIRKIDLSKKGDEVLIDGEIRYGNVKIENGDIKNQRVILGKGKMIPGFEENLIGLKENDEKIFSLKIPHNFWIKEWQGKLLEFKIKVKGVFRREIPELSDEFARSVGKFKDLSHMEKSIEEGLYMEKEREERERWRQEAISKIVEFTEFEVPRILIEKEKERIKKEIKKSLENAGLSFEDYLLHLGKSILEFENSLFKQAEVGLKQEICLLEIAKNEGIEVKEEEIEEKINHILRNYSDKKEAEKKLDLEYLKSYFFEKIFLEKTFQKIEEAQLRS